MIIEITVKGERGEGKTTLLKFLEAILKFGGWKVVCSGHGDNFEHMSMEDKNAN